MILRSNSDLSRLFFLKNKYRYHCLDLSLLSATNQADTDRSSEVLH
jgi:hypothetical protein